MIELRLVDEPEKIKSLKLFIKSMTISKGKFISKLI